MSWVWQHAIDFNSATHHKRHEGKTKCIHCDDWYSRSSNTTTWAKHLFNRHKISPPRAADDGDETIDGAGSRPVKRQATLQDFGVGKLNFNEQSFLTDAVIDYVIGAMVSHNTVESTPFKDLLAAFKPGYTAPSRRTVGRRVIERYTITLPVVCDHFTNLDVRFSIAFDGWSNQAKVVRSVPFSKKNIKNLKSHTFYLFYNNFRVLNSVQPFWLINAQWIDTSTRVMKNVVLHIIEPDGGIGLGKRVAKEVFEFLRFLGRPALRKLLAIITDNGSDAVAAARELMRLINDYLNEEVVSPSMLLRCADHSIQLAVKEALAYIAQPNDKLRRLIKAIRASKTRRECFRAEQRMRGQKALEPPVLDSETRWNSCHQMDSDALKKKESLQALANRDDLFVELERRGASIDFVLTPSEWKDIEAITKFLSPIRNVMEACSRSRGTTINELDAMVAFITRKCEAIANEVDENDQPTFLSNAASAMLNKLGEYKKHLMTDVAQIGQFLDPAFRKVASQQLDSLKETIRDLLRNNYGYNTHHDGNPTCTDSTQPSVSSSLRAQILAEQRNATATVSGSRDEVERFADVFIEVEEVHTLNWWYLNRRSFPHLYKLAMDYLGIPASSTSVERANSEAGREFSDHRMRLSGVMFRASMCARSFSRNGLHPPADRQQAALDLNAEFQSRYNDMLFSEELDG